MKTWVFRELLAQYAKRWEKFMQSLIEQWKHNKYLSTDSRRGQLPSSRNAAITLLCKDISRVQLVCSVVALLSLQQEEKITFTTFKITFMRECESRNCGPSKQSAQEWKIVLHCVITMKLLNFLEFFLNFLFECLGFAFSKCSSCTCSTAVYPLLESPKHLWYFFHLIAVAESVILFSQLESVWAHGIWIIHDPAYRIALLSPAPVCVCVCVTEIYTNTCVRARVPNSISLWYYGCISFHGRCKMQCDKH